MRTSPAATIDTPTRPAAYDDSLLAFHESRKKVVDNPVRPATLEPGTRIVFQTLWRTPNERVPTMKVAKTDEVIIVQRLREAIPNPFLEVDPKTKKAAIHQFNDGTTRRLALDDGESLTGTIDRLRVAAKTLDPQKGVRVALDGDKKSARSFRFELIPYTQRTPKATATA